MATTLTSGIGRYGKGGWLISLCMANLLLALACPRSARGVADMRSYCNVPPLPGAGVKANLLLMIDNSASMYDLAYTAPSQYCVDDSFSAAAKYSGYFDEASLYSYKSKISKGSEAGNFVLAQSQVMPASTGCNAANKAYLCVDIANSGMVDNFVASGKFLNWLFMSKLDIEKMALTGGKFDPGTGILQAESRGCQGKSFIKMSDNLTFAVRGPIPSESDYVYQASHGGVTRIDIYGKPYRKDDCLAAVTAWQARSSAEVLKTAALACMSDLWEGPPEDGIPSRGKVYTEAMSYCYSYLVDGTMPDNQDLLDDCFTRIWEVYGDNADLVPKSSGDAVCGTNMSHSITYHGLVPSSSGFLGQCYAAGEGFTSPQCSLWQSIDFCKDIVNPALTDPSLVATMAGTSINVPGYILDAGIYNLGDIAATMVGRIALAAAPSGVIQQFSDRINFGAMVFNDNGAGSECSNQTGGIPCTRHCQNDPVPRSECYQDTDCTIKSAGSCAEDPHTDGGKIISYVNHTPVGDHSPGSGLVASIDALQATAWTPLAESFYEAMGYFANRSAQRLQAADFDTAWPPSQYSCQKNSVLMVTDGISTADRAQPVNDFVTAGVAAWVNAVDQMPASSTTSSGDPVTSAPPNQGSYNIDDLAWIARNKNLADAAAPIANYKDFLSTYVVYTGVPCGDPVSLAGYNADGSCATGDEAVPEKLMQLVASKGGGRMVKARNPADLQAALTTMLQVIGAGSNSGTDASILATGDSNGALYLQEQFYPSHSFDGGLTSASWIGEMQGLWYYIDPFLGSSGAASTIREDTGGNRSLDLLRDRVVRFSADAMTTRARLFVDRDGDGAADSVQPSGYPVTVPLEGVQSLWRAGLQLWSRSAAERVIYTQTDGQTLLRLVGNGTGVSLDLSSAATDSLLQAGGQTEAAGIVSFVQGADSVPATRDRGVSAYVGATKQPWKLGDIISSTPALQSPVSLANYHLPGPKGYGDLSYGKFIDTVNNPNYGQRGTVYVGANDGMLHAFRLGSLKFQKGVGEPDWPASQKAVLAGDEPGKEQWAFVPRNALPYLRYLREPNYPHLYYVDGSVTLADVSLGDPGNCPRNSYWTCPRDDSHGKNWRTILIGGMGLGGASRDASEPVRAGEACVRAPLDGAGLSSYFALDVTDQTSGGTSAPKVMWEFAPPGLGFATSGAAVVKINAATGDPDLDSRSNGRWFAVFASGPTGTIETSSCQFQGKSDQNLLLFVVDLNAAPPFVQGRNYWVIDTHIPLAFGGNITGAGIDIGKNYQDDALYLGYTRAADDGSWTGGVLRLLTKNNLDPGKWVASKVVDGVGPVSGRVTKLQDRGNHNLWLYFGTGRYFNRQDDLATRRALLGVKEPCYTAANALVDDGVCSAAPLGFGDLMEMTDWDPGDQALTPQALLLSKGWWIGLDAAATGWGSERVTLNATAITDGSVFFTSFKPATDICQQGASYLWDVKYNSGGSVSASVNGKYLVQLSNGSSAELSRSDLKDRGGRRSPPLPGKAGGVKLITNSGLRPVKKIIHIQER